MKRFGAWLCKDERCDCFLWLYGRAVSPEWSKELLSGRPKRHSGVIDNVGWAPGVTS